MGFKMRTLGKTGLNISPIGLGVMQFAGGRGAFQAMFPAIPEPERDEIIRQALAGGINWFDTAELYGRGQSEEYLAASLQAAGADRSDVVIATKWSPFLRFASNIRRTIDERLNHLKPYPIDLYQIHNPWSFSPPEKEMQVMAELVQAGKIRSVGVSNFNRDQMYRAQIALSEFGLPLASNQVHYNLLNREIEANGLLDAARDLGVTIISWSPLASGLLTGKFHRNPEILSRTPSLRRRMLARQLESSLPVIQVLEGIAADHGTEPAQVALSWLIHSQGDLVVAIPGASRVGHVQESIAAMQLQLSRDDMGRLDEVSRHYRGREWDRS